MIYIDLTREQYMDLEKIKGFVYHGAEGYSSIVQMRKTVYVYLLLTFVPVGASVVGDVFAFGVVAFTVTLLYVLIVYTFPLRCPQPSFSCRFAVTAFHLIILSLELQLLEFTILYAGKYIGLGSIALILGLQILSAAVFVFIKVIKVKKGKYLNKKEYASSDGSPAIVGASSFGYLLARMLIRNTDIDSGAAAIIATTLFTALSVVIALVAAYHLLKYYYCKKYRITCDENGVSVSQKLILPEKKKSSLAKKIGKAILWGFLLLFMCAYVYGMYHISRGV